MVFGVSLDAFIHGGSNDIIGGRRCHRGGGPISPSSYTLTPTCGGKGVIKTGRVLMAAALLSRSYVIRIVFSLPMSSSLVG